MAVVPLDDTTNLVRLFLYTQGETEVPPQFYIWAFLSTIAAAVGDRVYVKKLADHPVRPNRYTVLIGPSGCGKGTAVAACTPYVEDIPQANLYEGAVTAAFLTKLLHKIKNTTDASGAPIGSKIFLVMEELAMDFPSGSEARTLLQYITGYYVPKKSKLKKGTLTSGTHTVENLCINWLACSTREWFSDVFTGKDLQAGPSRRIMFIEGAINPLIRKTRIVLPYDVGPIKEHLHQRFEILAKLSGEIKKTDAALAAEDLWYQTRPEQQDPALQPLWHEMQNHVNSLATLLVLADGGDLVMKKKHFEHGLKLATYGAEGLPRMLQFVKTLDSGLLAEVHAIIQHFPGMTWQELTKASGMFHYRLQTIVNTLMQAGRIFTFKGADGKVRYSTNDVVQIKNTTMGFLPPKPPTILLGDDE